MSNDGPDAAPVPPADVAAVAALDPPPTSVRDVKTRLRWRSERAAAALRAWRSQRSRGVPAPTPPAASAPQPVGLAVGPNPPPQRPPGGPLRAALEEALAAGGHGPEHAAAVALARRYADQLDAGDPDDLGKYGRALLAVLVELRLTPRTRAALTPNGGEPNGDEPPVDEQQSELERFRLRRDRRAYRATPVDPTAT